MEGAVTIKERVQKWDLLKLVLIFSVVLGHLIEFYVNESYPMRALWCWIYSFHMPLFIFVTGLFSKKNINEKRYDKIISYIFIYIVAKVLLMFTRLADGGKFSFSLFTEKGLPWYVLAVFAFCLITIALKRFPKSYVFAFAVLLACMVGYDNSIGDFLALSRIIVYYPFFFAGYCLNPDKLLQFLSKTYRKVIAAIYFIVYTGTFLLKIDDFYVLRPLFSGRNPFSKLGELANYGCVLRLGYYVLVFLFCASVIALIPNKLGKKGYLASLGSRTLQVYILHFCVIYLLYGWFDIETVFNRFSYYLIIPLSLLITWFCSLKFWEKPLQFLINPELWKWKKKNTEES